MLLPFSFIHSAPSPVPPHSALRQPNMFSLIASIIKFAWIYKAPPSFFFCLFSVFLDLYYIIFMLVIVTVTIMCLHFGLNHLPSAPFIFNRLCTFPSPLPPLFDIVHRVGNQYPSLFHLIFTKSSVLIRHVMKEIKVSNKISKHNI